MRNVINFEATLVKSDKTGQEFGGHESNQGSQIKYTMDEGGAGKGR